jgi:hypothetical protein
MQRMGHLAAFARAWFDLGVFAKVARQRGRRTLGFYLLLVLFATLTTTLWATVELHKAAKLIEPHLREIPNVTIKNGVASADVEQPWVRSLGNENGMEFVLIIDTTGKLDDFAPDQQGFFLKRTSMILKKPGERRETGLDKFPDAKVGPDTVRGWIDWALKRLPFLIGLVLLFYYASVKLMQALVLVLVALLAASGRKRPLEFGALFTVAVYALVPAVLADALLLFLPFSIPYFWLLYFVIGCLYVIFGMRRIPDEPPAPPAPAAPAP